MNAVELINEIIDIVNSPLDTNSNDMLKLLNQADGEIADRLLLPGLADGHDTVTTVTGDCKVSVPSDYHKGLFLALCDGEEVDIYNDLASLTVNIGPVSSSVSGDISGITVMGGKTLFYKDVPEAATDIELFYYRKPVAMTRRTSSYPDGLTDNEDYDQALINRVCQKVFNKIEDGMEGNMANTQKHKAFFEAHLAALDVYAEQMGKMFPTRPKALTRWLGD